MRFIGDVGNETPRCSASRYLHINIPALPNSWGLDHPIVLVGCELNYHSRHNDITYSNHAEKCFQDGSLMLFTSFKPHFFNSAMQFMWNYTSAAFRWPPDKLLTSTFYTGPGEIWATWNPNHRKKGENEEKENKTVPWRTYLHLFTTYFILFPGVLNLSIYDLGLQVKPGGITDSLHSKHSTGVNWSILPSLGMPTYQSYDSTM